MPRRGSLPKTARPFSTFKDRSRVALKTLYEMGLEKPLTTDEYGPAQLLPFLVKALEEVMEGIGPMAEVEARVLSSAALTGSSATYTFVTPALVLTSCWNL